ncbi:hypothetical protein C8F01DRAFT_1120512 [Mycena amicta]|nr:hypothetical protein C8F01DRAFT_1120512 [Mycena amicta]
MSFATSSAAFGIKPNSTPAASSSVFGAPKPAPNNVFGGGSSFGGGNAFGQPTGQQPQQNQTGSVFGQPAAQNQQQQGGLFGQQQPATGLFGQPQQQPQQATGSGLFGQPQTQQQPAAGSGLFGQSQQPATGGLFGQPQTQQPAGGGLFGQSQTQPATGGGLFGQSQTQQPAGGGLFGGNSGGGLFGASQNNAQTSGGLFGGSQTTQQPAASGGLFGGGTSAFGAPKPAGSSLFGGQQQQQPQQTSNLFGGTSTTTNPLFGGASTNPLFGGAKPAQPQMPQGTPPFAKSTKFNDLPDSVKKTFEEIDTHIQGRIQISKDLHQRKLGTEATKGRDLIRVVHTDVVNAATAIHTDLTFVRDLRSKTDAAVEDTIVATRIIDGYRNPHANMAYLKDHAGFPLEFFTRVTEQMRERLAWYKSTIEQIERKLSSSAGQAQTPQSIHATLQAQNATFLALAAKTATLDAQLQRIKQLYAQLHRARTGSFRDPFEGDAGERQDLGLGSLRM